MSRSELISFSSRLVASAYATIAGAFYKLQTTLGGMTPEAINDWLSTISLAVGIVAGATTIYKNIKTRNDR